MLSVHAYAYKHACYAIICYSMLYAVIDYLVISKYTHSLHLMKYRVMTAVNLITSVHITAC
jgi:hypothetical protein